MTLSATICEKAALIWIIADQLTVVFGPRQYGEVIRPLTVIHRFDSVLESAKRQVLKTCAKYSDSPLIDGMLKMASGHVF